MTPPTFLNAESITTERRMPSEAGGAGPRSRKLSLTVDAQLQSNWCWAAVSKSLSFFYDQSSTWTQCKIADAVLGREDCCGSGASSTIRCNIPFYLDRALTTTSNFVALVAATGGQSPITFEELKSEIANGRAIATRVGWHGGGGHFQAITGWTVSASGDEYITVWDPIYLDTEILMAEFADKYQAGGRWTHAYLTATPMDRGVLGGAVSTQSDDQGLIGA